VTPPLLYVVPPSDLRPGEPARLIGDTRETLSVAVAEGATITPELAEFISGVSELRNRGTSRVDSGPPQSIIPTQRCWKQKDRHQARASTPHRRRDHQSIPNDRAS
jgi:hypothetical protein